MTFAHYWDRLKAATPGLGDDENRMTISVLNFRLAISRAYAAGRDDALQGIERTADELTGHQGIMDVFKGIFGGGR
jgi:hypothetical protein